MTLVRVILLGAGGHAKVVLDALQSRNIQIAGVADPRLASECARTWRGIDVLGDDEAVLALPPDGVCLVNGIGSVPGGTSNLRHSVFSRYSQAGYQFLTVIHAHSFVSASASLGEGVQIMAGAVVQADVTIGANTLINTSASVDHDCTLGSHCHIAPGTTICGGVNIGDAVHVGTGASVVQGVSLGTASLVGAGVTVRKDVAPGTRFVGAN